MSETKTYTEEQVSEAASAARGMILGDIGCDQGIEDLLALMVNATVSVLTSGMQATFEDVIEENYGEPVDDFKSDRGF